MSKPVKKRTYTSVVRQEQAEATRTRIVEAAGRLFLAKGYGATSIKEIAAEAGVATDTVYATFGTKVRVLTALVDARLSPAPGVDNVMDRPEAQAVRAETDQRRQIALFAADISGLSEHVRPIYEILRTASAVEPELASVLAEMDGYRFTNIERLVGWIAARGRLKVTRRRATQIVWALASPDMGRMLCDLQGWTRDEYADWLASAVAHAILPD